MTDMPSRKDIAPASAAAGISRIPCGATKPSRRSAGFKPRYVAWPAKKPTTARGTINVTSMAEPKLKNDSAAPRTIAWRLWRKMKPVESSSALSQVCSSKTGVPAGRGA